LQGGVRSHQIKAFSLGDYLRLDAISITSLDRVIFSLSPSLMYTLPLSPPQSRSMSFNHFCLVLQKLQASLRQNMSFHSWFSLFVCACACVLFVRVLCACRACPHNTVTANKENLRSKGDDTNSRKCRECGDARKNCCLGAPALPNHSTKFNSHMPSFPEGFPHEFTETTTRAGSAH
jgi:hypothetical protein